MTKTISLLILEAVLIMSLITLHLPVTFADSNLIESTCKQTPFVELCVSTLKSDPRGSEADVSGLARIAADGVNAKATATLKQINGLLKGSGGKDPELEKALKGCVDKYNAITEADIPVAIDAILKGNPKFAVGSATDAANEAQACEKGFGNKSPISDSNQLVHDLSVVLQSIASLLL